MRLLSWNRKRIWKKVRTGNRAGRWSVRRKLSRECVSDMSV